MSKIDIPVQGQTLWATGDLVLGAEVELLLRGSTGNWQRQTFLVDSGSNISSMPAWRAKALGLPMPRAAVSLPVNTPAGQFVTAVRSGLLQVQVVGMGGAVHVIPCHFTGDPDLSPDPSAPPVIVPRNLLGLAGVIDKLRLTWDGTPVSAAAPYGLADR